MVIYFKRTHVAISDNIEKKWNKNNQIKILLFIFLDGIKLKAANMLSICQMESSSQTEKQCIQGLYFLILLFFFYKNNKPTLSKHSTQTHVTTIQTKNQLQQRGKIK